MRRAAATARMLITELATEISSVLDRRDTAWDIDHALWALTRAVRTEMQPDQDECSPESMGMVPDSQELEVVAELTDIRDHLDMVLPTIGGAVFSSRSARSRRLGGAGPLSRADRRAAGLGDGLRPGCRTNPMIQTGRISYGGPRPRNSATTGKALYEHSVQVGC